MNDQMASPTPAALMNAGSEWLTLPFVLIGLGILGGLLILFWGARLARRRHKTRHALEDRGEAHYANSVPAAAEEGTASADTTRDAGDSAGRNAAEADNGAARVAAAPPVAPSPPPIADAPTPATMPVPSPTASDPEPEPDPLNDEPIAAAAPLDASPASVASDMAAPRDTETNDDLTRMKGVGPRLAERLNGVGITRFDQLAVMSPEEATALDAKLGDFRGRLHRDRWIEQAGFLARGDIAGYEAVFGKL